MDETKRPLLIPPEFVSYAEKHNIFDMYKRILEEIIVEKPNDPISYMIDMLKRENDDIPQIIVLGPPSSGKQTIAKALCNKLRAALITPQGLLNESESSIQQKFNEYLSNGKEVPSEMWVELIRNRVHQYDCQKKGWVMAGFPETRQQAIGLQAVGVYPKHFVLLCAPDTVLLERAVGKRIDPKTHEIYHITFDYPSAQDVVSRLTVPDQYSEADLVKKLVKYHRHIQGIMAAYGHVSKEINADQPKADVLSQVMTFISSQPRSVAPHTPRVVLLGPPGGGKHLQASILAKKYNIVNVNCGELVKQAIADETKNGLACKPYADKNMAVPDTIVLNVLKERLSQLDCSSRGWVLHGYPRTREQAEQLNYAGFEPNRVFFLDVPNDAVMERLSMRATDPITGQQYHLLYNPPRTQAVRDRLLVHDKDQEQGVRDRLSRYSVYGDELEDFYDNAQHINGDQDPHTVFESIESRIVNPIPRQLFT